MQFLKPIDYLINYIMYIMKHDIKIELVKYVKLSDGLCGRLYDYYNQCPDLIEEHLQLIPNDVKEIVNNGIDEERKYIETYYGGC